MLKKLILCTLTILVITLTFGIAYAESDMPELTLEELIEWKKTTLPEYVTEEDIGKVSSGNLYEEYYGIVVAASAGDPLRAFATCDHAMFRVSTTSTITIHPTGGTAPYRYLYEPYRRESGETGYYSSFGANTSSRTLSITPEKDYAYLVYVSVYSANGDYVEFYNKYETVTNASLSDSKTVGGKVKAVIASEIKSGMTDRQKALAIHDWLTHNAYYDHSKVNHDPDGVLLKGKGVCESYARAFQMFMSELGIPNVYVTSDSLNHAWNMIYVDGGWYHVDVTWDDPGSATTPVSGWESREYFCVTDAVLSRDHTWNDTGLATPVTGTGPMYPDPEPISVPDAAVGTTTLTVKPSELSTVRFTAPSAGTYIFKFSSDIYTKGHLLDENYSELDYGTGTSITLYRQLAKNQVIYVTAEPYSVSDSGSVTLNISKGKTSGSVSVGENKVWINADTASTFKFTVPSDGLYCFETGEGNTIYGYLFDENMNPIAEAENYGPLVLRRYLLKDQVVNIRIRYSYSSTYGTETLKITKDTSCKTVALNNNTIAIQAGKQTVVMFVAPADKIYSFETTGSMDPRGYLYDENMQMIASNDDGGTDYNFRITKYLTKNQLVFIGVDYYSSSDSGNEILKITAQDLQTAPSATLTTLTGRSFTSLPASGKPKLLVFTKVGCWNCSSILSQLSGYDLSALDVVIAGGESRSEVSSYYADNASGITGATMSYNADNYMWRLLRLMEPGASSVTTPVVFYISADNQILDYTTGYDNIIQHIRSIFGVNPVRTDFSGKRLTLPTATTTIEAEAFKGTGAQLIEIPAGCTSIASNAFSGCSNLKIILNHSGVAITPPAGVVVTDIPLN